MNDQEFLKAVAHHSLTEFPHRAHLRMAWLYLRTLGPVQGQQAIKEALQHLAAAHGAPGKYHETITLFWARVVQHAIDCAPEITEFDAFLARYPFLLKTTLIAAHYSPSLVQSDAARQGWVEPDLIPMP